MRSILRREKQNLRQTFQVDNSDVQAKDVFKSTYKYQET